MKIFFTPVMKMYFHGKGFQEIGAAILLLIWNPRSWKNFVFWASFICHLTLLSSQFRL